MTTSARINPEEPYQWLLSHPILVSLNRCNGSFNTLDDLSSKRCVQNTTKHVNLILLHMIAITNESKDLQNILFLYVNVNLMVKNVIQSKSGKIINVSAKTQENIR